MAKTFEGGRFADGSRAWQAAEETPITGWNQNNLGIFAVSIGSTTHGGDVVKPELRWRNKTDVGPWTVLGATGEVKAAAVPALVDEANLLTGNFGTSSAKAAVEGVTCEQENSGIATNATTLAKDQFTELQCGISFADGIGGKEYEFALYESGSQIGISLVTVTLAVSAPNRNQRRYRWTDQMVSCEPISSWLAVEDAQANIRITAKVRLRIAILNDGTQTLPAEQYKLQYDTDPGFSAPTDVAAQASATGKFRYYNGPCVDQAALTALYLTGSNVLEVVVESAPSALGLSIPVNSQGEWDITIDGNPSDPPAIGAVFYFRLVKSDGTPLNTYTVTPQVTIYGVISGITKDNNGNPLGSCEVALFKDLGGTPPSYEYKANTTSDVNGNYSFTVTETGSFFVRAQKDGAPNVFDTTDNVLQPS